MSALKVVFEPSFATKPMGFLITKEAPGYGHQNLILIAGSNFIISYINLTQGLIWLSVTKSDTPETWKKGNFYAVTVSHYHFILFSWIKALS